MRSKRSVPHPRLALIIARRSATRSVAWRSNASSVDRSCSRGHGAGVLRRLRHPPVLPVVTAPDPAASSPRRRRTASRSRRRHELGRPPVHGRLPGRRVVRMCPSAMPLSPGSGGAGGGDGLGAAVGDEASAPGVQGWVGPAACRVGALARRLSTATTHNDTQRHTRSSTHRSGS